MIQIIEKCIIHRGSIYNADGQHIINVYTNTLYRPTNDSDIVPERYDVCDMDIYIGITCTNFLHFLIDTITDYINYLKYKKDNINLKYHTYEKNKFIELFDKLDIISLLDEYIQKVHNNNDIIEVQLGNVHYLQYNKVYTSLLSAGEQRLYKKIIFDDIVVRVKKMINECNEPKKNIYLPRKIRDGIDSRFDIKRIIGQNDNLNEMNDVLRGHNFEEIYLEDYDKLVDKIKILDSAKIILTEASATSILFGFITGKHIIVLMGPYVLEVFPPEYKYKNKYYAIRSNEFDIKLKPNCAWYLTYDNVIQLKNILKNI